MLKSSRSEQNGMKTFRIPRERWSVALYAKTPGSNTVYIVPNGAMRAGRSGSDPPNSIQNIWGAGLDLKGGELRAIYARQWGVSLGSKCDSGNPMIKGHEASAATKMHRGGWAALHVFRRRASRRLAFPRCNRSEHLSRSGTSASRGQCQRASSLFRLLPAILFGIRSTDIRHLDTIQEPFAP